MNSLVWEALCWQKDPVLGPYADYRRVYEELRLYKKRFRQPPISQGSLVYKPTQGLTGWNNNKVASNNNDNNINSYFNNVDNNSSMDNIHINGNSVMDFYPFSYNNSAHNIQDSNKFIRPERQNDSSLFFLNNICRTLSTSSTSSLQANIIQWIPNPWKARYGKAAFSISQLV